MPIWVHGWILPNIWGRQGSGNHRSWTEKKKKKKNLNKDSLGDLRIKDNMKHTDICIIGIPEGDEGEKLAENLFKEVIG